MRYRGIKLDWFFLNPNEKLNLSMRGALLDFDEICF